MQEGSAPLNLYVEENFDRASSRGTGNVKTISNYAPVSQFLFFFTIYRLKLYVQPTYSKNILHVMISFNLPVKLLIWVYQWSKDSY